MSKKEQKLHNNWDSRRRKEYKKSGTNSGTNESLFGRRNERNGNRWRKKRSNEADVQQYNTVREYRREERQN